MHPMVQGPVVLIYCTVGTQCCSQVVEDLRSGCPYLSFATSVATARIACIDTSIETVLADPKMKGLKDAVPVMQLINQLLNPGDDAYFVCTQVGYKWQSVRCSDD